MSVKSGQVLSPTFVTSHPTTGAAADATGGPVGTLYVDGAATADVVTVTKPAGTGIYKATVTLPALTAGQVVAIHIAATVDAIAGAGIIFQDVADTYIISDIEALVDDIGAAGAGLTALGDTRLANLDATISSRSSHSAADVWSVATRTLSSYGTLVADIWSYTTRTLTSLSALVASIAAAVWAYATRTLTQSAASVAATVSGSEITVYRGDTWSISLTGLGAITGYTDVWFSMKDSPTQLDSEALLMVSETVGLERLNGAAVATPYAVTDASLVVDDASAGNITVTVEALASASIAEGAGRCYDVQWKTATGEIHTLTYETFNVSGDVTRATS